jgi:hypothetical protein
MSVKVLVACEESQEVCKAFRALGHEAYSCDIQECSGGHPEWHIQGDCLPLLNGNCEFWTIDKDGRGVGWHEIIGRWDMIIAFPPCTDLAVSGARHFAKKREDGRQQKSIEFFLKFTTANCEHIAIENPIGIMSTIYRKPDQIIQPFWFGDSYRKSTCLWLIRLPKLVPTNMVDPGEFDKNGFSMNFSTRYATDENGKILSWNDPRTAKARSKTPVGLAKAMAEQWGGIVPHKGGDE